MSLELVIGLFHCKCSISLYAINILIHRLNLELYLKYVTKYDNEKSFKIPKG